MRGEFRDERPWARARPAGSAAVGPGIVRAAVLGSLCAVLAACGGSSGGDPTRSAQSAAAVQVIGEPTPTSSTSVPASHSSSPKPTAPGSPSPYRSASRKKCTSPAVIAHRGDGAYGTTSFPENTSEAELDAVRHGASLMNVDVRWTADDVPVAIHDPTLDRTTTVAGTNVPVLSVTAAQFTALWAKNNNSTPYSGHIHPQTLARLLDAVKGTGVPIVIQMEADPFDPGGGGQASISRLAGVVSASGYSSAVVVGGWRSDDVHAFAAAAPGVRTALIQEALGPATAPAPSTVAATGARILYVDYLGVTPAAVAAWHQAGLAVWTWTPANPPQWDALRAAGVDAIATNWVPTYIQWAGGPCAAALP